MNADTIKSIFDKAGLDVLGIKPIKVGAALLFRVELVHYPEIDCSITFVNKKPQVQYTYLGFEQPLNVLASISNSKLTRNVSRFDAKEVGTQLTQVVKQSKTLQGFLLLLDVAMERLTKVSS